MARNTIHTVPYRRKREGRTHYRKRLEMLKGDMVRLVARRSNKTITLQLIAYQPDGDRVLATFNSRKLVSMGWTFSTKSIPACYLAGLYIGLEAKKKGVSEAIFDQGLQTPLAGSRLYAALKGAIDAGLSIPSSQTIFPPQERLEGKHISDNVAKSFQTVRKKISA